MFEINLLVKCYLKPDENLGGCLHCINDCSHGAEVAVVKVRRVCFQFYNWKQAEKNGLFTFGYF
jgi:hypothetical protein